jgi:hypothetical protein
MKLNNQDAVDSDADVDLNSKKRYNSSAEPLIAL